MKGKKMIRPLFLFLGTMCVFVLASCRTSVPTTSVEGQPEISKVRLSMGYIPNVQFAPFYVAVEKGFYRDAGVEIDFDHGFETDGVTLVGSNTLQFAVVSGEQVILARAQGLPVVYVMAWYQDYPVAVAAKKSAGVLSPQDLEGKKIGIPGLFGASYIGLKVLLDAAGLSETQVSLPVIGYNQVEALALDQVQAAVIYTNNEPVQLQAQGFELDIIRVSEYLVLPSNGLITNQTTIQENADLVRRMVQATLRGIQYTIEYPEESFEICKQYVDNLAQADQAVQYEILRASIELWKTDQPGISQDAAWRNMHDLLLEMKLLQQGIEITEAYRNDFVE